MSKQHLCPIQEVLQLDQHLLHEERAFLIDPGPRWREAQDADLLLNDLFHVCPQPVKGK